MTPKYFKEVMVNLKKPSSMTDEECNSLWIYKQNDTCISLRTTTLWERIKFLFHGHIWIGVLSGNTQPPIWLDSKQSVFPKLKKKKSIGEIMNDQINSVISAVNKLKEK